MQRILIFAVSLFVVACATVTPDAQTYTLVPIGPCTAQACSEADPCCNSCGFQSWALEDDFDVVLVGEVPEACEMNGCGNCGFTVEARGALKDGKLHIVSSEQVHFKAFAPTPKEARPVANLVLLPQTSCTELGCTGDNACCNTCTTSGYRVDGSDGDVRFEGVEAPVCARDGCGKCTTFDGKTADDGFFFVAEGRWDGDNFIVTKWQAVEDGLDETTTP